MPTEQQLKTLDKYVRTIHEMLVDQINGIRSNPDRQTLNNRPIYVRLFGQMLYEAPKLHTGLVSIRLVEKKLNQLNTKACHEHHHSRQRGGEALVSLMEQSIQLNTLPTHQQVLDIALVYCQVHYTTSEENAQLRKHQRRCASGAAYRRANIELVEARELFTNRGRHSAAWKQAMNDRYQPIIDSYNNPVPRTKLPLDLPIVIN